MLSSLRDEMVFWCSLSGGALRDLRLMAGTPSAWRCMIAIAAVEFKGRDAAIELIW
jgi:hypothetical protein